jgi:hypothetical protein
LPILETYSADLVADKGGPENITAGERRLVEIAQTARGASLLILAEAARSGFVAPTNRSWDLAPGTKELAKFLTVERNAIVSLGAERRAKDVPSLADYIREKYGNRDADSDADENGEITAQDDQGDVQAAQGDEEAE